MMEGVKRRFPQADLMALGSEGDLLRAIWEWRDNLPNSSLGINLETARIDSCINGYGERLFYQ